jgi:hypothetical protein
MESKTPPLSWDDIKHEPAKRSNVFNRIRGMLETELKVPIHPPIPLINLGLGIHTHFLYFNSTYA